MKVVSEKKKLYSVRARKSEVELVLKVFNLSIQDLLNSKIEELMSRPEVKSSKDEALEDL